MNRLEPSEEQDEADRILEWFDEATIQDQNFIVATEQLLDAYNSDARSEGRPVSTPTEFDGILRCVCPDVSETERTLGGSPTRVWRGIGLLWREND